MWNEAEWDFFWSGTDADYAQLLKVGYQATKAACPDCTVLFAGLHYWADPTFFERVLDILNDDPDAAANNYFFDVMSVHFYSAIDNAYEEINDIRSHMTALVPDHPIWLTETGVPVWDDASVDPDPSEYDWAATQQEAAAYVIQSYANAMASGVERYFFFRTHDADMTEYFGLIRNDRSFRPSYVAYQVANTYLRRPTFTTRVTSGGVTRVTLWGTPRGKVSVLWNTTPSAMVYNYPATLPQATRVNRLGSVTTIAPAAGVYALSLAGATANLVSAPDEYFIGGNPLIVIESETSPAPPTSTVHDLPAMTYAFEATVTWEGHDNESGVWIYDIQVRDGPDGAWITWLHSTPATSGQFAGAHGHTYCFRSRATDGVGYREEWPAEAQACTTFDLDREVRLEVNAVFGDQNSDRDWDDGESALSGGFSIRLIDAAGNDVTPPAYSAPWSFSGVLMGGRYTLMVTPDGWWSPEEPWMPRLFPIVVEPGTTVQERTWTAVGLFPHRADGFLPTVRRQS
jgi:hypothetical protein